MRKNCLAMTARNHPGEMRPLTEIYREVLDEAVLGEQLGFRSWWLAEHHFAEDQHADLERFAVCHADRLGVIAGHVEALDFLEAKRFGVREPLELP